MELSSDEEDGEEHGGGGVAAGGGGRQGGGPRQQCSVFSLIHHGGPARRPRVPVGTAAGPSSGVNAHRRRDVVDRQAPVFVQRRDYRTDWPKIWHSVTPHGSNHYLRLSQTFGMLHSDMKALCTEHPGVVCGLSRSCRHNPPVGYLWWWLSKGRGLSKEQHADLAKVGPTLAEREAARSEFESLDGVAEFLAAEAGGAGQGEPPQ